jgi:hypothetical protein
MAAENSQVTANCHRRGRGRPFARGVSGNPGGRPKAVHDIQELARQHTPEAIAALVAALNSPRERVSAATALLDRAWGRPTTYVAGHESAAPVQIDFRWADALPEVAPALAIEVDTVLGSDGPDTDAESGVTWGSSSPARA